MPSRSGGGPTDADPGASRVGRRTAWRVAGLFVFYAAVALWLFAPISDYRRLGSTIASGDPALLAWTFAWVNHAILAAQPLFSANFFYPTTNSLAYAEHHAGVAVWGLPIFAATGNAVLTYHVLRLAAPVLNALAAHVLFHRITRDHRAAALGALTYAFVTPRLLYGGHVPLQWTLFVPLLLVALDRWLERPTWRRAAVVLACGIGQVFTTSYLAVMTAIIASCFVLAWVVLPGWRARTPTATPASWAGRAGLQGMAAVAVGLAVAWPLVRPYLALDVVANAGQSALYSLSPAAFVRPLPDSIAAAAYGRLGVPGTPVAAEQNQFLGWIAMGLAAFGLLSWARRPLRVSLVWLAFFAAIAVAGAALSLGPSAPGGWMPFDAIAHAPGLRLFRVPARFTFLVITGLSGLVSIGALAVLSGRRARGSIVAGLLGSAMLLEWSVPDGRDAWQWVATPPRIYDVLRTLEPGAIVSLPCYRRTPEVPRESEYMVYSTHHWRPIVNGYGRHEPPGTHPVVGAVKAFPGPNSAIRMRHLGIAFVVLHTGRFPDGAADVLAEAQASRDFELVAAEAGDYLFRVRTAPGP